MALRGTRQDWEELLRRYDEGVGLKKEHVSAVRYVLHQVSPDEEMVEVDAMLPALQQVRERAPDMDQTRSMSGNVADRDESWWLHCARELGLMSIVPVEPWPRQPENFYRPPGYLHSFGISNPDLAAQMQDFLESQTKHQADSGNDDEPTDS